MGHNKLRFVTKQNYTLIPLIQTTYNTNTTRVLHNTVVLGYPNKVVGGLHFNLVTVAVTMVRVAVCL